MLEQTIPGASPASWFRTALASAKSPRAVRVARAVTVGAAAWEVGRQARNMVRDRLRYTVSVPATDEAYDAVAVWLTEHLPAKARRSLLIRTRRAGHDSMLVSPEGDPPAPAPEMRAFYDGTNAQTVRIAGHRVSVLVERKSLADGLTLSVNTTGDEWSKPLTKIVFTCYGEKARDAILAFLDELTAAALSAEKARPRMRVAMRWGDWRRVKDTPPRSLDTVILREGQRERIVEDLERFLASEDAYARVGIPWHRGLLFHGPPGCGKTSLATALADHFGFDVYLLPLSDLEADTNLLGLLANVDTRSVLVIEDIDVAHAATTRDDERKGVSMSGLLNALDGLATPHGLITIMTTNALDALDPALIRPGRADLIEEFGYVDADQAERLIALASGKRCPIHAWGAIADAGLTHAGLLDAAKPRIGGDPREIQLAMCRRIGDALRASEPVR